MMTCVQRRYRSMDTWVCVASTEKEETVGRVTVKDDWFEEIRPI